jgi:hypothetical protein
MPLKPFNFQSTDANTPEGMNWKHLAQNTNTIVRTNLSIGSPVVTPTLTAGYFTLVGPMVFYAIKGQLDNNDGWLTSSYIDLPYAALNQGSGFVLGPTMGEAIDALTGVVRSKVWHYSVAQPQRIYFATAYTNTSGSTQDIGIYGWFLRN